MKKLLICFIGLVFITGCSPSKNELYKETDTFVESLASTYHSYGLFGGREHSVTTSNGLYTVAPIGH